MRLPISAGPGVELVDTATSSSPTLQWEHASSAERQLTNILDLSTCPSQLIASAIMSTSASPKADVSGPNEGESEDEAL